MANTDLLIFVEDPGAANFVADLPAALAERGWRTELLADGSAKDHLRQRGASHQPVQQSATAKNILGGAAPRLLLVGTSGNLNTFGLDLVAQARSLGIESVGVVDALQNARHRFAGRTGDPLAYAPDWLLVPDDETKQEYATLGYPSDRIIVSGHPHFDYVHDCGAILAKGDRTALRARLFPTARTSDLVVIFAAEGSGGLNSQEFQGPTEYTFTGRGHSTGRTEIVLEEFLDALPHLNPRPYLVLRLHPKDPPGDVDRYFNDFDLVSKGGSSLELVYAADLIVGMTSIVLLEAAILGCATLSIVPRQVEKTWCPSVRNGMTPCVTNRPHLRSTLSGLLQKGFEARNGGDSSPWVFGSLGRIADFLEGLLEGQSTADHG